MNRGVQRMEDRFRDHYFVLLRMALLLLLVIYIVLSQSVLTGASVEVLLFLALFIGLVAGKELLEPKKRIWLLGAAAVLMIYIIAALGTAYILLFIFLCYEGLTYWKPRFPWYLAPLGLAFLPGEIGWEVQFVIALFMGIIYFQHDFIVESYRKQTREDTIAEQRLKHSMNRREHEMQEEVRKSLLQAENQMLEEREELSQTLHDKLGHNINGSVYQLEAVKVLMEKEPETSKKMIQAVIDQLRGGMDEIRMILRKERPEKYKLAILQLEKLCEDCRSKGVEAELITEGELKEIPEKYLEVILDNAYEAVSNSMKYAKCSRIKISVHVWNQMIRCSISDNGVGCKKMTDGMGISGMRKRMREVNGILDFETEIGFTINMLLPL
ncbi:MAG: hypothetical protein K2J95_03450 [Lachnospiraceae bacterium]|nr:hypothetical protein [Lachnospiraceae bacterium]